MGSAFGGGMGLMGETCGAVTSAVLMISLKYGASDREERDAKKRAYELTEKFIEEFRSRNKSIICRDLLGFNIKSDDYPDKEEIISKRCPEFIAVASEILEQILRGEDDKTEK
jgi:C_GCAxxG_C_C family probable redox protein